ESAIALLTEELASDRFDTAVDPQGRLIGASAELMALELMLESSDARFQAVLERLARRLTDYENSRLSGPQRRFLMRRLQKIAPEKVSFPTLEAEDLAALWLEAQPKSGPVPGLRRTALTNVCQFASVTGRLVILHRCD